MIHKIEEAPFGERSIADRLCSKASHAIKVITDVAHSRQRIPFDIVELEYAVGKLIELQNKVSR